MATNLHIDDKLLKEAVRLGKHQTKREAVNSALTEYVQQRKRRGILELFGTLEDKDFWDAPPSGRRSTAKDRNGHRR